MSQISTHVLDTARGVPAVGMPVALQRMVGRTWTPLAIAATDASGRVTDLGDDDLEEGQYRLTFDTASYFSTSDQTAFFPEVIVTFAVAGGGQHYHVPMLLNPFGYSTYRGT